MKKYIKPIAETMDFCAEGYILANSINVDGTKTTSIMFSDEKQSHKSIWNED